MENKYKNSILIEGKFNKEQQILWEILLSNAFSDLYKNNIHSISINTLFKLWGKNKTLKDLYYETERFGKNITYTEYKNNKKTEIIFNSISRLYLKNNILFYSYPQLFKEILTKKLFLNNLKINCLISNKIYSKL